MRNIYVLTFKELEDYFILKNDKKFRATQIYEFLYKKRIKDFDKFVNIGKNNIELLKKDFTNDFIKIII